MGGGGVGEASASPHVFIAIPSYGGSLSDETVASLEGVERLLRERGVTFAVSIMTGDCYVQHARNTLVHQFMESGAESLFFIDDDVGFPPEAFVRLVEMPDDMVFGVYPLKREDEGYPVVIHTDISGYPIVRRDGCISASGAPTGFLRIKRAAIERIQAANPHLRYDEYDDYARPVRTAYDLFPQGAKNGRWWGEDIAFCNLWTEAGGEIWCVPDIDMTHTGKGRVFQGNYHRFLMRQPRMP